MARSREKIGGGYTMNNRLPEMIRVFPRKTKWTPTDYFAFVGDPPLFRPASYYPDVSLGGPTFDDPGGEFTPGVFLKEGVTITSRGCPKRCPFCFVPKREGPLREYPVKDGWIVQDN